MSPMRATNPIPAAAIVDPVAADATKVSAAQAVRASHDSTVIASQPPTGGTSNRTAV